MDAQEVVQIQRRVMGLVRAAGSAVATLQNKVDSILMDTRLTQEAKQVDVATALGEGRGQIQTVIEDEAGGVMQRALAQVDWTLGRLKDVSPEALARSELGLRAALGVVSQRPELLLNLYRERHLQPADRVLIEEAVQGMIDVLGNSDNYEFRNAWNSLQQELALARGPEELEALGHRAKLEELGSYLESARTLVHANLALMDPSLRQADRERIATQQPFAESAVHRYETENAWVMEDGSATA